MVNSDTVIALLTKENFLWNISNISLHVLVLVGERMLYRVYAFPTGDFENSLRQRLGWTHVRLGL